MSKPSGWKRWRKRGGYYNAGSLALADQAVADRLRIAGSGSGSVARAIKSEGLIVDGQVSSKRVKDTAESLASTQRETDTISGRQEAVAYVMGRDHVSELEAEERINREKQTQARAVLAAAQAGRIKLKESEKTRLESAAAGDFLSNKGLRYRAASTGGGRGMSDEARIQKEEHANDFRINVARYGARRSSSASSRGSKEATAIQGAGSTQQTPGPARVAQEAPIERKSENPFARVKASSSPAPAPGPVERPVMDRSNPWAKPASSSPPAPAPAPIERAKVERVNPFAKKSVPVEAPAPGPVESSPREFLKSEPATQFGMFGDDKRLRTRDQGNAPDGQISMFRQNEIAQFGVNGRPQGSLGEGAKLRLVERDDRSDEEKETDSQRAAESKTRSFLE